MDENILNAVVVLFLRDPSAGDDVKFMFVVRWVDTIGTMSVAA